MPNHTIFSIIPFSYFIGNTFLTFIPDSYWNIPPLIIPFY
ncbi:hypothetical protein SMKC057_45310 [Serratia marcescens]|nr:hypothetical protein SMKC057_45310 [Serratia marcescens]